MPPKKPAAKKPAAKGARPAPKAAPKKADDSARVEELELENSKLLRENEKLKVDQEEAATKIQALTRGRAARRRVSSIRDEQAEAAAAAAAAEEEAEAEEEEAAEEGEEAEEAAEEGEEAEEAAEEGEEAEEAAEEGEEAEEAAEEGEEAEEAAEEGEEADEAAEEGEEAEEGDEPEEAEAADEEEGEGADADVDAAATKIQCAQRQRVARKRVAEEREATQARRDAEAHEAEQQCAALTIQSAERRRVARDEVKRRKEAKQAAAVAIDEAHKEREETGSAVQSPTAIKKKTSTAGKAAAAGAKSASDASASRRKSSGAAVAPAKAPAKATAKKAPAPPAKGKASGVRKATFATADEPPKTPSDPELLQQSWGWIQGAAAGSAGFGRAVYDEYRAQDEAAFDHYFGNLDMDAQALAFANMISGIVGLAGAEQQANVIERLGERHAGYGVDESHIDDFLCAVRRSVLRCTPTAADGTTAFTDRHIGAWSRLCTVIRDGMAAGMHSEAGKANAAAREAKLHDAEEAERENAAIRIQAAERGRAARRDVAERRQEEQQEDAAAPNDRPATAPGDDSPAPGQPETPRRQENERRDPESAPSPPPAKVPAASEVDLMRSFGRSATLDNRTPKKYDYEPIVGLRPPKFTAARRKSSEIPALPPIKPKKKIRVTDDPHVVELEARMRQRKAEQRKRQLEIEERNAKMKAKFDEQQAARAEEKARAKLDEQNRQREAQEARLRYYEELQEQRLARLQGKLKIDPDVMAGKKRLVDAFDERRRQQEAIEEAERKRALDERKKECAMGRDFYSKLGEHDKAVRKRQLQEEKERLSRVPEKAVVAPLPKEFRSKARQEVLSAEEEERRRVTHAKEIAHEKRAAALAYADEVKRHHRPGAAPSPALAPAPPPPKEKKEKKRKESKRRESEAAEEESATGNAEPNDTVTVTETEEHVGAESTTEDAGELDATTAVDAAPEGEPVAA